MILKFKKYWENHDTITISVITYYEIMRGIKALSSATKLKGFHEFMSTCNILDIDISIADKPSDIYDELRKTGKLMVKPFLNILTSFP